MHDPINHRDDSGPFDIVGDVHGCADELRGLLVILGYDIAGTADTPVIAHPQGRRLIFAGDVVNRGPKTPETLRLARAAITAGGYAVEGNHDQALGQWLAGDDVTGGPPLQTAIEQLAGETAQFRAEAQAFLVALPSHCWLDGGGLVVVHAGLEPEMFGLASEAVRQFAVHGESPAARSARARWAHRYRGEAAIVHGHTPVAEAEWLNNTICIDTGCVAGGRLTALRWPERELVSVPAAGLHTKPSRPFIPPLASGA